MSKLHISMPLGIEIECAEDEILTQLGPLTFADMQAIAESDGEALERAARAYYPWWSAGFGADFYRGLALNAMWMSVSWSAPINDEERQAIDRVLGWCMGRTVWVRRLPCQPRKPAICDALPTRGCPLACQRRKALAIAAASFAARLPERGAYRCPAAFASFWRTTAERSYSGMMS